MVRRRAAISSMRGLAVLAVVACGHPTALPPAAVPATERIALGALVIEVSTSRTADVFHAVDQLSHWSEFNHPQYASWAPEPRDPTAEALLQHHRALRTVHGWG